MLTPGGRQPQKHCHSTPSNGCALMSQHHSRSSKPRLLLEGLSGLNSCRGSICWLTGFKQPPCKPCWVLGEMATCHTWSMVLLLLQELLANNEHRQQLMQSVWQAFLVLAEHAMKVCPRPPAGRSTGILSAQQHANGQHLSSQCAAAQARPRVLAHLQCHCCFGIVPEPFCRSQNLSLQHPRLAPSTLAVSAVAT